MKNSNYSFSCLMGLTIITHSSFILSNSQFKESPSLRSNWFFIEAGNVVRKLKPSLPAFVNFVVIPFIILLYVILYLYLLVSLLVSR